MNQKTAWIIGASYGIGRALAENLNQQGWNLVLSARTEKPLKDLQKGLSSEGETWVVPCDVAKEPSLKKAYEKIQKISGKVDLVVFAAGIYTPTSLEQYNHKDALNTLNVNLSGAFNVFEVIRSHALDPRRPLHLVWVASVAGYRGLPNSGAYGASKAALINFAEVQRAELGAFNTKVQVVNPGFVKTRLTDKNTFQMPMLISPEKAAEYIARGLKSRRFDIAFPPFFAFILKLLRILPDFLYFKIAKRLDPPKAPPL